jgi:2-(1,2-epoxy-1,2-dihydrophenyl)acetyl-CoA isomerase
LVTKVVDDGAGVAVAEELAAELSQISLQSFACSKKLITDSFDHSFEHHLELERVALAQCAAHSDGIEGMQAFLDKRKPEFNR